MRMRMRARLFVCGEISAIYIDGWLAGKMDTNIHILLVFILFSLDSIPTQHLFQHHTDTEQNWIPTIMLCAYCSRTLSLSLLVCSQNDNNNKNKRTNNCNKIALHRIALHCKCWSKIWQKKTVVISVKGRRILFEENWLNMNLQVCVRRMGVWACVKFRIMKKMICLQNEIAYSLPLISPVTTFACDYLVRFCLMISGLPLILLSLSLFLSCHVHVLIVLYVDEMVFYFNSVLPSVESIFFCSAFFYIGPEKSTELWGSAKLIIEHN